MLAEMQKFADDITVNDEIIEACLTEDFDFRTMINRANELGYDLKQDLVEKEIAAEFKDALPEKALIKDDNGELRELDRKQLEQVGGGVGVAAVVLVAVAAVVYAAAVVSVAAVISAGGFAAALAATFVTTFSTVGAFGVGGGGGGGGRPGDPVLAPDPDFVDFEQEGRGSVSTVQLPV